LQKSKKRNTNILLPFVLNILSLILLILALVGFIEFLFKTGTYTNVTNYDYQMDLLDYQRTKYLLIVNYCIGIIVIIIGFLVYIKNNSINLRKYSYFYLTLAILNFGLFLLLWHIANNSNPHCSLLSCIFQIIAGYKFIKSIENTDINSKSMFFFKTV
jgi:vacuolar-type H+-ATPase subunit I/STV1